MTLEIDIENEACELILTELHVINVKIKPAGTNGWPDRLFFVPGGKPLFIEFKRPGKEARKLQKLIHRRLRHYGYEVQTHDTVQGAFDAVQAACLAATRIPEKSRKVPIRK